MPAVYAPELETRRRRLDELFADEPYLSATMRASRLHERADPVGFAIREQRLMKTEPPVRAVAPEITQAKATEGTAAQANVARLGFVVSVRQDHAGLRAEVKSEDAADVLTAVEAARFLRIGQTTLRHWVKERGLPSAHMGHVRRYRKSAILRWLKEQERLG